MSCLLEDADENINVLVCIKISEIEVIYRKARLKNCSYENILCVTEKTIYGEYLHKNVLKM